MNVPNATGRLLRRAGGTRHFPRTNPHRRSISQRKPGLRFAVKKSVAKYEAVNRPKAVAAGALSRGESLRQQTFRSAAKYGYLKTSPAMAEEIYKALQEKGQFDGKTIEELAKSNNIELIAFTSIARLLLRSQISKEQQSLGSRLLHACSAAKEPNATIELVKIAHRRDQLHLAHFKAPLSHLAVLVREMDPRAMVLQAQMFEDQGKLKEALTLYQKATSFKTRWREMLRDAELDDDQLDIITKSEDPTDYGVDSAYTAMGALYARAFNDTENAIKSFEKGALEGGDPEAFHALAQYELKDPDNPVYTEKYIEYETKAAASCHLEAAYAVAKFYAMTPKEAAQKTTPGAYKVFLRAGSHERMDFTLVTRWLARMLTGSNRIFSNTLLNKLIKWYSRQVTRSAKWRLIWALQWSALASHPPPFYGDAHILNIRIFMRAGHRKRAMKEIERLTPQKEMFSESQWMQLEQIRREIKGEYVGDVKRDSKTKMRRLR
ncbi:hypothetical protein NA57DRAFT_73839 [Rhizodiscina lignyota]|uniref:Uncharacterized protein n=1 Tax=Rhizodiscina lignyota TaxID=1504668 RepID=A0A9P4IFX3_9PEZI|nr:hypothetical protein NA57DRAFT_73839 [Rhizodiscina lignyota]